MNFVNTLIREQSAQPQNKFPKRRAGNNFFCTVITVSVYFFRACFVFKCALLILLVHVYPTNPGDCGQVQVVLYLRAITLLFNLEHGKRTAFFLII